MRNLAIIPARSGSVGLHDKNIKLLTGIPLLGYSVKAAVESGCFDTVMVSTDSPLYATIARAYGAEVKFLRSNENSTSTASTNSVCKEVLLKYKELGEEFDTFTILQPTSPLRGPQDIKNAFDLFNEKSADAVVSITELEYPANIIGEITDDLNMKNFFVFGRVDRRQDAKKIYRLNGAIYISKIKPFLESGNIYSGSCYAYLMDNKTSIDIDSESDFSKAENLILNEDFE